MYSITKTNSADAGFCNHGPESFKTTESGPLTGLSVGVKDLFAVEGYRNSAGNPDWYASHEPATQTATALNQLLHAGVEFKGFTLTDELAYSLEGNNHHYGKVMNPVVPGHACGGSTMGSAAAVAGHWADIGLGTDTGGSIRIPASYCGLFGIRPSHGSVSIDGLIGLAPRFDTVGWLTRSSALLNRVGQLLLPACPSQPASVLYVDKGLFNLVQTEFYSGLKEALIRLEASFESVQTIDLGLDSQFKNLADVFRILQGRSIAEYHGSWLKAKQPTLSTPVQARMEMALAITDDEVRAAEALRRTFCTHLEQTLPMDAVLFLPTTPTVAPKLGEDTGALRPRLMQLTSIAGLTGSAQVHLPLLPWQRADKTIMPYGFSFLQRAGHDLSLLKTVESVVEAWNHEEFL
ncbi:MAG: amidase family protein [Reinekea sp.]